MLQAWLCVGGVVSMLVVKTSTGQVGGAAPVISAIPYTLISVTVRRERHPEELAKGHNIKGDVIMDPSVKGERWQ